MKTTRKEREALRALLDECEQESYCLEEHLFVNRPSLRDLLYDADRCAELERQLKKTVLQLENCYKCGAVLALGGAGIVCPYCGDQPFGLTEGETG